MGWFKRTTRKPTVSANQAGRALPPRRPLAMALEPRVMFDGAVAVSAAQITATPAHDAPAARADVAHDVARHDPAALLPHELAQRVFHDPGERDAAGHGAAGGRDVLFVDARVQDAGELLAHVRPGTEVVYLDQGRDGLTQMRDYLDAHPGAASVQIIAHGNDGDLWLGSTYLSADNIGAHAGELAQIGADMQSGGDILIYACNTAAGDKGASFVTSLAQLTHRDVAASNDRTGAGADWNLEVATGTIDATPVLSAADEAGYAHDLATITVTSNADSGAGSLRAAIASATSGDTITFNSSMTISLTSGELAIAKNLTIDGDLDNNGTPDVTLDAGYHSRVIDVTAGTVTLDGLVIEHGLLSGNGASKGQPGGSALGAGISNAGTLTLVDVTVSHNYATGGGGTLAAAAYAGGGGGGGSGVGSIGGGTGGTTSGGSTYTGQPGGGGSGGNGGSYNGTAMVGHGGTSAGGGAGGSGAGYANGGAGGSATVGGTTIGGGGGGSGWAYTGTTGGNAAGGIYNSGTLFVLGTSAITSNAGAAGGGGGGQTGGIGGIAAGGIWNTAGGTVHMTSAAYSAMTGNAAGGGSGGYGRTSGTYAATGAASAKIHNISGGIVDTTYVVPTITSATYDVSTGTLIVTGANMTAGDTIAVNKLSLSGEGGSSYTLTSSNVTASSATSFTVTLNATDQAAIDVFLNKNGSSSTSGTTYNLAGAANWDATVSASADTTGNGITVSNVAVPTITSVTYDESTGALVVTGTGFTHLVGATNDIVANKFTFTGEGGSTYTLTDTANVEIASGTSFTLLLSATDRAGIDLIANKNGTSSTGGTTYNLAAAEDWAAGADPAVVVADTTGNGVTISNVAVPSITSATYDAATGTVVVTGNGFLSLNGASNDIVANKFTFTGEGGSTYTLTDTANVDITSGTSFTLLLSATDRAGIDLIANKNGTSSTGGTTYNLAAAEDWAAGANPAVVVADTTGNGVTISNVAVPSITSATYDAATGTVVVTGNGFLSLNGASNDIVANKFTFTGEGGSTYTLTDTANVDITSGTSFTLLLSATDRAGIDLIANKNGTSSTGGTTYNLAAAEDWAAGANPAVVVADTTGNGITVSNVAVPSITSATYDAATGTVVVTGNGFLSLNGASNDIVANKFTFTGEGGSTYTLTDTANVDITSGTSFTLLLSATDRAGIDLIANKNGTSSTGGTTYNLAAAEDWVAGADPAVVVADTTGNGITVSNVAVPSITSATYDAATGTVVVTGNGFLSLNGASNDIVANKFTFTGEGGSTYTLTDTANVDITSGTSFTLLLSATDRAGIDLIANKNGTSSTGGTTYNLAAAEDWAAGANPAVVVADTTGNGVTISNVAVPTITSATYDAATGTVVVTGNGFLSLNGASNDIVASKLTFTGAAGSTYTLTSGNVDITNGTSFTITLNATDKAALNLILNKNGTSSADATTYNLAAAEDWNAGADAAVVIADTTGNGVTVSNFNATPVLGNLNGDSVAWAGVGNTVDLDLGSNATTTDAEFGALNGGNGDWAGGSLTVQRAGTAISSDTFGFDTAGASFTVSGNNLQSGGLTFATFTNTGGVLTISFTSSGTAATTALVQDVARHVSYRNDTPAGDASVRLSLSDGNSATTADLTVSSDTIYVTNVADTATIDASDGTSLSEAVAIAAADSTGSQSIVFASSLAGQTITLAGNLAVNESLSFDSDAATGVVISGSTITLGGGSTQTWSDGSGHTATINSTLAGSGGLTKTGAGTLTLGSASNAAGWSGAISITGGTLATAGAGAAASSPLSTGNITLDGGTLSMIVTGSAGSTATVANNVTVGASGGTVSVGGGGGANIVNFSGVFSGSGALTKTGAAIMQLSGSNSGSFSGSTTVSAGTLRIGGASNLGSGAITLNNATLNDTNTSIETIANNVVIGSGGGTFNKSSGTLTLSGTLSGSGSVTNSGSAALTQTGGGTLTLDGASVTRAASAGAVTLNSAIVIGSGGATIDTTGGDITLKGNISGSGALTKQGGASGYILWLYGNNTYSGAQTVVSGWLVANSATALGSGQITLDAGTTLGLNGGVATFSNNIVLAGDATIQSATPTNTISTFSGVISETGGSHNLTLGTGSGTNTGIILSGANTWTGTTTITGSNVLQITDATNLSAAAITLGGATLQVNGSGVTLANAITLTGSSTLSNANAVTFSGVISGGQNLTKSGAGTLTLSNTETYTGSTTVSAGTLRVDGALGATSGVTVASGGTLGGTGSIFASASSNTLTVQSGGTLAPGDSGAGTLTVNGNLSMASGSTLAVDIAGATAGTQYDQVIVNGTVNVSGATLAVNHSYTAAKLDSYQLIANDGNDAIAGTFTGVSEGGTLTAGGDSTSLQASYVGSSGNDFTLTVPDMPPVISNLDGDSVSYTEKGGAVLLDAGSNATVTDSDSANFNGGNLTVAIITNQVSSEDVLSIVNQGTGAGQIGVAGSNVSYGGVVIGTFTGGSGGSDLVITLNGNATPAAVQALARDIAYRDSNAADPSNATRTIRITVNDGSGGTSNNADVTVNITTVNDAPTLTTTSNMPTFTENGTAVSLFSGTTIDTVEAGQTIKSLTLTVSNVSDGSSEILNIDGTAVALTNGNSATTANNGMSVSVSLAGGTATVTISDAGGISASAAQTLVNGLSYRDSSDNPNTSSRVVTLTRLQDSGGTANGGIDTTSLSVTSTVSMVAVNDAPVVIADGGSAAFVAGDNAASAPVTVDAGLTVTDVDSATLASATVTITGNFRAGEDVLGFVNNGSTMGNITASYNATTGVLTLTSSGATATLVQWQAALRSVTYTNTAVTPDTATRTVSFTGNDGTADSAVATRTVTVTATDQTPIVTTTGGVTDYTGGASAVTVDGGISVGDLDNATQSSAIVAITTGFHTGDVLGFTNTSNALFGNITASYNAATGVMTLTSAGATATNAQWANALSATNFSSSSTSYGHRTIDFSVNDGNQSSAVATDTVNVLGQANVIGTGTTATDGSYKIGDTLYITVSFDQVVNVDTSGGTPALLLETGSVDRSASYVSGSGSTTLTFAYTVQAGDSSADLDYASSTALTLNGGTIRNVGGADATLSLPAAGGASSLAGQHAIVIDGIRPTASINLSDTALKAGETSTVTITFSEAVSGVDAGDFTVENGTLSGLATADGGLTWTATFTPTANITDASNLITLDNTGYLDAAGNTGAGTTVSGNYAIDTARPTASITLSDTALKVGDTSTVTITFSEAVSGVDAGDFTVENGTLSGLATADGGLTWTATFTPTANITDASNLITLDNTGYLDAAGNTGAGTTVSGNYAIDTARPTASITLSDTALKVGDTSTVTITFSEAVSGVDAGDFTVENGTLSGLATADGGLTWTATFTPTANITDASNLITLDNTGYLDAAGNTGAAPVHSPAYAVDTQPPQLGSIERNDTAVNSGQQGVSYTITFSEDVTGLTAANLQLVLGGNAHAAIRDLVAVDGHTYVVQLDNVGGTGSLRLDMSPGGIADLAGNPLAAGGQGQTYTIGGVQPVVLPSAAAVPGMPAPAPWFAPTPAPTPVADTLSTIDFQPAVPAWRPDGLPVGLEMGSHQAGTGDLVPPMHAFSMPSPLPAILPLDAGDSFVLPLAGPEGLATVMQVSLADGRALPDWLHFDPASGVLEGRAPDGKAEVLALRVVYVDAHGQVHARTVEVRVTPAAHGNDRAAATSTMEPAGKPALQAQFGAVRQAGLIDHAALLHQLAVAQRHASTAAAP
jgi:hypothetical protein